MVRTDAKQGDYILIDVLLTFEFNDSIVELVFLVAPNNEQILHRSRYECSSDGKHWVSMHMVNAQFVALRCNGWRSYYRPINLCLDARRWQEGRPGIEIMIC